MFKLFILAAVLTVAAARPSYLGGSPLVYAAPHTTIVEEPSYAKIGTVIKSIPTAVSHQSISQVHSSGHYVEPIIAPVYKTYAAPAVHSYASPYAHSYGAAPLLDSGYATYGAGPVLKSYAPSYDSHYGGDYYGNAAW